MFAGMTMLAAAAAEAAQDASKSGLPQLNSNHFSPQLFWLVLTFAILLLLMSKVALPRIGEVIAERRERIRRDLEAAAKLKSETDQALADYEKALAEARMKASGIAKDTRQSLANETDAERAKIEAQLSSKLQDAEARITATKVKALASVNEIAADTASAVIGKLIGQDVSAADVKAAIAARAK